MNQFLSNPELTDMRRDFALLLGSPEATTIWFDYQEDNDTAVDDNVFHVTDYTDNPAVISASGRAIQQIVTPRDERLLKFGILETGDAIFYTSTEYDLTRGIAGSLVIRVVDQAGGTTRWKPVPRESEGFYNYLLTRLGNLQLGQIIPCKIDKRGATIVPI